MPGPVNITGLWRPVTVTSSSNCPSGECKPPIGMKTLETRYDFARCRHPLSACHDLISANYFANPNGNVIVRPDPIRCGICLGFVGTAECPRFIIKDERHDQLTTYFDGIHFTPDSSKALVFDDFAAARDEAWRLRSDYVWAWFNDFFGKGAN